MTVRQADMPEFLIGIFIVLLGLAAAVLGSTYGIGSAADMGSGFFPVAIGTALALVGLTYVTALLIVGRPITETLEIEATNVRAIVMISIGIACWIFTVRAFGLIPATVILVISSGYAEKSVRPAQMLGWALILAFVAYGVFVYGLGLPLLAFSWPL